MWIKENRNNISGITAFRTPRLDWETHLIMTQVDRMDNQSKNKNSDPHGFGKWMSEGEKEEGTMLSVGYEQGSFTTPVLVGLQIKY